MQTNLTFISETEQQKLTHFMIKELINRASYLLNPIDSYKFT